MDVLGSENQLVAGTGVVAGEIAGDGLTMLVDAGVGPSVGLSVAEFPVSLTAPLEIIKTRSKYSVSSISGLEKISQFLHLHSDHITGNTAASP